MKLNIQLFADGKVIIEAELSTKSFDRQIASLEYELEEYERQYEAYINAGRKLTDEEAQDFQKLQVKMEQTKNRIISLREQQDKLNTSTAQHSFNLTDTIRKIGKWTLALFGVRSAYMFVRQAASTLSNTNKQIGTDIEYMRWALAQTLEKVIVRIIQWAYKLLQIINYVVYGVTGINLFANASAKAFERQQKAMGGTAKSAKQLQKTLAGFDEMNILQKNGDTGYGGGGGGVSLPSEDLSKFSEISGTLKEKLDKIIKVLKPIWEWIVKIVKQLGGLPTVLMGIIGLGLIKKIAGLLGVAGGATGAGASGLLGVLSVLGLLVADVWLIKIAYSGIKEVNKEAKNLNKRVSNLTENILSNSFQWRENSKKMVENAKAGKTTEEQNAKIVDGLLKNIHNTEELNKDLEKQKNTGNLVVDVWNSLDGTTGKLIKTQRNLNIEQEKDIDLLTEMYEKGKLNKEQKKQLAEVYEVYIKKLEKEKEKYREGTDTAKKYAEKIEKLKTNLSQIKGNYNATINVNANDKNARKTLSDLLIDVKNAGISGAMLGISNINNAINKIKYAKGGIINMPGRGVPIAYGGERGQEGVIPLTDSQQMALLGEAIGKYITINATIQNNMNGRVISRELQKIQSENSFASNL